MRFSGDVGGSYRVGPVFGAVEMDHAINAGESSTSTTIPMRVEFLLGQDIAAGCVQRKKKMSVSLLLGSSS